VTVATNPRAYYRLDEPGGTIAYDSSGNGYNATVSGATLGQPSLLAGDTDTCMLFTASGGLTFPPALNIPTWTALTLEFWINLGSGTHYVVVAVDATSTNLFLDGNIAFSGSGASVLIDSILDFAGSLMVGGYLDEVAVYNYKFPNYLPILKYNIGIGSSSSSQNARIYKFQVVKVYDPSGNFIDVIRDAPLLSCKENINAAADTVTITLPRRIDAFDGAGQPGSLNTIVSGNVVQWWLYGAGLPSTGLLKFQGKIDEINPTLDESEAESVGVTVTPFSQVLGDHGIGTTAVTFGTAGSSSTYVDTGAILRSLFTGSYVDSTGATVSVLDPVTSRPYGDPYTMDPASLVSTGQMIAFPFQNQKLISVSNVLLALSTATYFLRMNQDKTVLLGAVPSDPTHTLLLGQHLSSIEYSMSNVPRKNVIVVEGAGSIKSTATGASADPSQLGPRVYYKSDNRITDQHTCDLMAAGILSILDRETVRAKIKVPDYRGSPQTGRGYDIETFKVGQTLKIVDARAPASSIVGTGAKWGTGVWGTDKWGAPTTQAIWGVSIWGQAIWSASLGSIFNQVVTIVSVQYDYYSVTLELGARAPSLSRALFDIELRMQDATLV